MTYRQPKVFVGDVGNTTYIGHETFRTSEQTANLDIEHLTNHQMFSMLIQLGMDPREIIGVKTCIEHIDYVKLEDRAFPEGQNLLDNGLYCRNCFTWFRTE